MGLSGYEWRRTVSSIDPSQLERTVSQFVDELCRTSCEGPGMTACRPWTARDGSGVSASQRNCAASSHPCTHTALIPPSLQQRSSFLFLSSTLRPVLWRSRGWCVARRCQCFLCGVCCDAKGAHGERLGDPLLDCFIHSHEVLRACAPLMIARRVPSGALLRPLRRRMSVVPAFSQQPSQTCRRRPLRRHGRGSL